MGQSISAFRGAYDFLSNFYPALITYNGLVFQNNEAAFQAAKCPERSAEFCTRSAKQNSGKILIWQSGLSQPAILNLSRGITGVTTSGASVTAMEKIGLARS